MNFNEYQKKSQETIIDLGSDKDNLIHFSLGLVGEAGEAIERVKKVHRDKSLKFDDEDRKHLEKELGDVLWYLAQMATVLDLSFNEIAEHNIEKLQSRKARGKLHGSGDNR